MSSADARGGRLGGAIYAESSPSRVQLGGNLSPSGRKEMRKVSSSCMVQAMKRQPTRSVSIPDGKVVRAVQA